MLPSVQRSVRSAASHRWEFWFRTRILAVDGRLAGLLGVTDPIKATTPEALETLHAEGSRVIMLTGDSPTTAEAVARELKNDEVIAEVLPEQKQGRSTRNREGDTAEPGDFSRHSSEPVFGIYLQRRLCPSGGIWPRIAHVGKCRNESQFGQRDRELAAATTLKL